TSQRIRVLAANQRAKAADRGPLHAQVGSVAVRPGQLLRPGRHQLAMTVQEPAVRIEDEVCVPHRPHADGAFLGHANRQHDSMATGYRSELLDLRPGNFYRVVEQTPVQGVLLDRRVEHVPEWEGRDKGFGEDHKIGAGLPGFGDPLRKTGYR